MATVVAECEALLVNDIKVLASQLNERILQAQQKGFQVKLETHSKWKTSEDFMRETVNVRVWREIS